MPDCTDYSTNYRVIPGESAQRPQKTLTDILASSLPFTFSETSNSTRMQSVFTPVGVRSLLSLAVFATESRNSLTMWCFTLVSAYVSMFYNTVSLFSPARPHPPPTLIPSHYTSTKLLTRTITSPDGR